MKGKTICKTLGLVLLALLILVMLYVVYVFAGYHRIGDQSLSVMHCSSRDAVPMEDAVETGAVYRVSSANAGFGAYSADYSFFMDGGRESLARQGSFARFCPLSGGRHRRHAQLAHRRDRLSERRHDGMRI